MIPATLSAPLRPGTAPPAGDAAGLLDFRDRLIDRHQTYRNRHMQRITRDYWYLLGRQSVIPDIRLTVDGGRAYVFRDIPHYRKSGQAQLPRPVSNYLAPAVEVEMAAQTKRQWTPSVLPDSDDPRVVAAAKVAKDVLSSDLERDNWGIIRDRFTHQTIVAGTGIIWSWWDENWNELVAIDPGSAVRCAACGGTYHSSSVDRGHLTAFRESGRQLALPDNALRPKPVGDDVAMEFAACPGCGGSLEPQALHPDELYEQDMFGRELGLHVPKGYPRYENVACHEFYPDNGGINTTPENIRRFAIRKVRSISQWLEERYPERVAEVTPGAPYELMAVHPILGEWDYLSRTELGFEHGIYDEHVFVDTLVELPTLRYPKGRLAVIAGDIILEDGDLMAVPEDAQGNRDYVPKHMVFCARYKERPDEFWGESLLDQQISPQNRINRIDMQEIDTMVRLGSPHILKPDDMDLTGPEYNPGYGGGKFLNYSLSPSRPQAQPEVFGGQYFYQHFKNARDAAISDIKQGVGPTDVEIGEAPRNIGTTSGLQVLGEQAERRRAARERAIVAACERAWSHRLQLLWCLRTNIEEDEYEVSTREGSWSRRQYTRLSILGQTRVRIEKQAYIDKSLYQREAAREAQADGLYVIDSPQSRKRLLELRGLPTNVNEDHNRQIDHAERMWSDFMDSRIIPVIDETLDEPVLHHQILGTALLRDDTRDLEDACGWPAALHTLAGWQERLALAKQLEAQSFATYGARVEGEQAAEAHARAYDAYDRQMRIYEQLSARAEEAARFGAAPALPPPPTPPPQPFFLPAYLPDAILQIWMGLLKEKGFEPPPPTLGGTPEPIEPYLRFRAVYEAYRVMAEAKMAAAAMPPPQAPGMGNTMVEGDRGAPVEATPAPPGQQAA